MRALVIVTVSVIVFAACSDAVPCSTCPDVEGTYAMTWSDAGLADQPCAEPGPRPPLLTLRQSRDRVNATVDDVELSGTLYDSYDLTMTGLSSTASWQFRALVMPTGTSLDGGIRLTGTLTARRTATDGGVCEARDGFVGTKNAQ